MDLGGEPPPATVPNSILKLTLSPTVKCGSHFPLKKLRLVAETITGNHNWSQCRDQPIVGAQLVIVDTSATQHLYLRLREYHGRKA